MIKWIKKNWNDSVLSKVFAWAIIGLIGLFWIGIQSLFKNISIQESFYGFIKFLTIKISIPIWTILVILIIIFFVIKLLMKRNCMKKRLKANNFSNNNVTDDLDSIKEYQIIEGKTNILANNKSSTTLNSKFLGSESGVFSIWAYVSDIHNSIQPSLRYMYIVGYATNKGNLFNNPGLADYPNAWAIVRIAPTDSNTNGVWCFFCNNINKERTTLSYHLPLSGGWHLFSIAWSINENYIKFIIDDSVVDENEFNNWPTDFSHSLYIGTWPTRSSSHFFESQIGNYRFIEEKYSEKMISEYFKKKQE